MLLLYCVYDYNSVLRRAVRVAVAVTPMMMLHERSTELRARVGGERQSRERNTRLCGSLTLHVRETRDWSRREGDSGQPTRGTGPPHLCLLQAPASKPYQIINQMERQINTTTTNPYTHPTTIDSTCNRASLHQSCRASAPLETHKQQPTPRP